MTVANTSRKAGPFAGNGVTTSFPFTFKVFTTADIALTHETSAGVQTALVLGSDYSITLNADQDNNPGGTITYPLSGSPLATGARLIGIGALNYEQGTDITNLGSFNAQVHEDAFDRQVILTQQLKERVERALVVPVGDAATGLTLPAVANRANKTPVFDSGGNLTVAATPASVQGAVNEAAGSATSAAASAVLAQQWASQTPTAVSGGEFSSKYHAQQSGTSASTATTAKLAAESARDAAAAATRIYATTAAGLAAVASGQYFYVPSTNSYESLILYLNNAGSAVEQKRLPSYPAVDDIWHERLFAAQARYMEQQRQKWTQYQRPKALILIALGQSNNAIYNNQISGTVSTDAFKPVGGVSVNNFAFYAANSHHTPHWNELASAVAFAEGTLESTLSGAILMLQGSFPRIYAFSAAFGGFGILDIAGDGPRTNLFAAVLKLCDHARTAGYEPVVAYTFHQGEANMSGFAQLAEATYKTYLTDYIRLAQQVAAMAMDQPGYDAPVVFHTPGSMSTATFAQGICNAIVMVSKETANGILAGGMYQWEMGGDLVHGSALGFRQRSEFDGYLLSKFFAENKREAGLRLVDAVRTASSLKLTFSHEVTIDTSLGLGTTLNAANALYGIEYTYNGTNYVAILSAAASGRIVTCTLASNPGVAAGTEQVRIAVQLTNGAGGTWPQDEAGSAIRSSTEVGFLSPYNGARQYLWAAPHYRAVRG